MMLRHNSPASTRLVLNYLLRSPISTNSRPLAPTRALTKLSAPIRRRCATHKALSKRQKPPESLKTPRQPLTTLEACQIAVGDLDRAQRVDTDLDLAETDREIEMLEHMPEILGYARPSHCRRHDRTEPAPSSTGSSSICETSCPGEHSHLIASYDWRASISQP